MADELITTSPADPRAQPLIDELTLEYDTRYREFLGPEGSKPELFRYPPEHFLPPHGSFVLLIRDGQTIGGGAFMRYDDTTAEFKRIWTDHRFRRQGLARRVMQALEEQARAQGYGRVYLTTGFRQPEAVAFYRDLGYTALFETGPDGETQDTLPFTKVIGPTADPAFAAPARLQRIRPRTSA